MPTVCNICTVMFKGVYALKNHKLKKSLKYIESSLERYQNLNNLTDH